MQNRCCFICHVDSFASMILKQTTIKDHSNKLLSTYVNNFFLSHSLCHISMCRLCLKWLIIYLCTALWLGQVEPQQKIYVLWTQRDKKNIGFSLKPSIWHWYLCWLYGVRSHCQWYDTVKLREFATFAACNIPIQKCKQKQQVLSRLFLLINTTSWKYNNTYCAEMYPFYLKYERKYDNGPIIDVKLMQPFLVLYDLSYHSIGKLVSFWICRLR